MFACTKEQRQTERNRNTENKCLKQRHSTFAAYIWIMLSLPWLTQAASAEDPAQSPIAPTKGHATHMREYNARPDRNSRLRLHLKAEERILYADKTMPERSYPVSAEIILPINQTVEIGLPVREDRRFRFEISTRLLRNTQPDPDLGDPRTDVWLAVEATTDWSDSFADIIDLPEAEGVRKTHWSPGQTRDVLKRWIDARDFDGHSLSQVLKASVTLVEVLPQPDHSQ